MLNFLIWFPLLILIIIHVIYLIPIGLIMMCDDMCGFDNTIPKKQQNTYMKIVIPCAIIDVIFFILNQMRII